MTEPLTEIETLREQLKKVNAAYSDSLSMFNDLQLLHQEALTEVARLNKWADEFSDAQLKERALCEEVIRELRTPRQVDPTSEIRGIDRYRVEKTKGGFWPCCVRAGTGTRELYIGHRKQCLRVAEELVCAFEDGKYAATITAQKTTPIHMRPEAVESIARAFWRRIAPYAANYRDKELPEKLPVEFAAHMATALSWLDTGYGKEVLAVTEKENT